MLYNGFDHLCGGPKGVGPPRTRPPPRQVGRVNIEFIVCRDQVRREMSSLRREVGAERHSLAQREQELLEAAARAEREAAEEARRAQASRLDSEQRQEAEDARFWQEA